MNDSFRRITVISRKPQAWKVWGYSLVAALLIVGVGCRGSSGSQRKMDSTLQRHVKHAGEAYSDGQLQQAIAEYRKAIQRAWAMDDPYESGTAAYNLAACLASDSQSSEARDWLLDARVELSRAGAAVGNVWLLEAKIAQHESRLEDVHFLIQRAACSKPPCSELEQAACCGEDEPCCERCVANIPCLGKRFKKRQAEKECQDAYQAQIHLLRARLAAEQYDVQTAKRELACACNLAEDLCSCDVHAELHNVAALIHIAKGEYLQAARHLDREAEKLRWAGNYREIPTALELASAAYEQAGLTDLAADRLCRVARAIYGRGDVEQAWRYVQLAGPIAEAASSETTQVRLALLANEILVTLSSQGDELPSIEPLEELGMLAPLNRREQLDD